jgi:hypothetical protein
MSTPNRRESSGLSLIEAVETLSQIAELDVGQEKPGLTMERFPFTHRAVDLLLEKSNGELIHLIKSTFRTILTYLQDFYRKGDVYLEEPGVIDRIKTIMVIVGEAAKKLDKYTMLFQKAHSNQVTKLKEYKKLQEFYLSQISRRIDEGKLGTWILGLSQKSEQKKPVSLIGKKNFQTKHLFIDLESVRKDLDYELFYLKKEDGSRYFNPRLIRNLKLVDDFGGYFNEKKADLFEGIGSWRNKEAQSNAVEIIRASKNSIEKFFSETAQIRDDELVEGMRKAVMALMLAALPHHLAEDSLVKNCSGYFDDFLFYLRRLMHTSEYQHLIAYPPKKSDRLYHVVELAHLLCKTLYTHLSAEQENVAQFHRVLQQCKDALSEEHRQVEAVSDTLHSPLLGDYAALEMMIKFHPNGPIHLILESLEDGKYHEFDPLILQNLPSNLFALYAQDSIYRFMRCPTPTSQESIQKAVVNDEFKGFLRACGHDPLINKCLIINFQERDLWKERARAEAIEDLADHETFAKQVAVLTLPKENAFYHQAYPYQDNFQAELFMKELRKQIMKHDGGFLIPEKGFDKKALSAFVDWLASSIHRVFFSEKNVLSHQQRLDFIEIFYLFFQLKVIEQIKPDLIAFVCKDGLDISSTAAAELFVFVKLLSQERLSENDREHLDWMLHAPCLMHRERMLLPERFYRFLQLVKLLESSRSLYGRVNFVKLIADLFGLHYHTPILQSKGVVQRTK